MANYLPLYIICPSHEKMIEEFEKNDMLRNIAKISGVKAIQYMGHHCLYNDLSTDMFFIV